MERERQMNIIDEIYKRNLETRRGRIHFFPGNWVFNPTKAQLARSGKHIHTSTDATGQKMYCIKQQGAWCNNSDKAKGYPKDKEREAWYLPAHVCRKCEHHQKGKRRGVPRYPTCAWRASKNARSGAASDTQKIIVDAMVLVDEIMN